MDEKFRSIFEQRYRRYGWRFRRQGFPIEELFELRSRIDSATEEEGLTGRIRSDAKVFLLINLYEMFIRPVASRQGITGSQQAIYDISIGLDSDLVKILRRAAVDSHGEPEITARHVLNAVNAIYSDLNLSRFSIWG
jgi:hypothetical protein